MSDFDVEGDRALVARLVAEVAAFPPRDVLRAKFERRLIEGRGLAWVEAHRTMLDSQWEAMIDLGLV